MLLGELMRDPEHLVTIQYPGLLCLHDPVLLSLGLSSFLVC